MHTSNYTPLGTLENLVYLRKNYRYSVMKIKSILVSQPKPSESSPYLEIAKKEKVNIEFRPFIHVEGVDSKELRAEFHLSFQL